MNNGKHSIKWCKCNIMSNVLAPSYFGLYSTTGIHNMLLAGQLASKGGLLSNYPYPKMPNLTVAILGMVDDSWTIT